MPGIPTTHGECSLISRRQLAKGVAAGIAVVQTPSFSTPVARADSAQQKIPLPWTEVHPGVWKARLGAPEQHTPVTMRLVPPLSRGLASLPRVAEPPVSDLRGQVTSRGSSLTLPLAPAERLYGFGLQLLSFEQRGRKRIIRVNADPKGDSGDSHAPIPFYVSTQGYAVLVDTLRHAEFYCGEIHLAPEHALATLNPVLNTPQETAERERNTASQVLVEVPRAAGVDVYLFAGPSVLQAVQRYNLFSGGGVVPPEWGLGFWYRPDMHSNDEAVLALADEFRTRKIPCDVLGLEPGWQTHAYSCTFVWEPERFPDPDRFLADAAARNYRINLWEHAFAHPASPIFSDLRPHSGNYGVWGGLVPDFAGSSARRIFGDYHGTQLIDHGVAGFKLDECDNSDYTSGWSFPDMTRFPSGLDGEQMHALFGLRYQHAIWQQFLDRRQTTWSLVRSSGALSAPYPFVLYSDLYEHRQFVRALVNSGFSGLLWCPEVRDAASREDLIRRLQTVVFSPLAMVNAWYIRNPPWKQLSAELNNRDILLDDWQSLETQCREIIGWRMQLIPYLLSAFERYAADGTPPFRSLVLDHPEDEALAFIDDEYLIGDRMLVAPLFAGEPSRSITLPAGDWHDYWTGQPVARAKFDVPASTERIPVYVKAGTVLPVAAITSSTADPQSRSLTARVYGDGHLPWRLTSASGAFLELSWNSAAARGTVRQQGFDRPWSIAGWKPLA